MKKHKNKDFTGHSRIYIWHRFEQAEADCFLKGLQVKTKRKSIELMKRLIDMGRVAETLTESDQKSMNEIIEQLEETILRKKKIQLD